MTAVPTPSDERLVRMAARALGRHGLVHAYGHCSMRLDEGHFLVCAPVPMGQMPPADAVRTEELINYFRYDYPLPETREAHVARLQAAGFSRCDVWFQCLNFASLIAIA